MQDSIFKSLISSYMSCAWLMLYLYNFEESDSSFNLQTKIWPPLIKMTPEWSFHCDIYTMYTLYPMYIHMYDTFVHFMIFIKYKGIVIALP